jgi:cyclin-dependent kinase 8/11
MHANMPRFKPDKEGELQYSGISQSAIREMALCTELAHPNVVHTVEIILEDKCIYIVFEYAEHDLLQIIHHHNQPQRQAIPAPTIKSILYQLLQGLVYLHRNWVMHRDLKPANIMVTSAGKVKIGDLGLARLFYKPLQSLFSGDKVVVTIWYRAPELLLGSRHYTPAVDLWAVGCIFAELLSLRPIFKGEEAKMDSKKTVPFQRNQMQKIVEIMGMPSKDRWPLLTAMPEYPQLSSLASRCTIFPTPGWRWSGTMVSPDAQQ